MRGDWLAGNAVVVFVGALLMGQAWQPSDGTRTLPFNIPVLVSSDIGHLSIIAVLCALSFFFALASMIPRLQHWASRAAYASLTLLWILVWVAFVLTWLSVELPDGQWWSDVLWWGGAVMALFIPIKCIHGFWRQITTLNSTTDAGCERKNETSLEANALFGIKKACKVFHANFRTSYFLLPLCVSLAVVLIYFTKPGFLAIGETIQAIILLVLVCVIFWYAKSTHMRYQVALNAERNTVYPIVKLTTGPNLLNEIWVAYENIGRGPTLNLRVWLEGEDIGEFAYLKSDSSKNARYCTALGIGEIGRWGWTHRDGELPDFASGFDVVASYTDVFQQCFVSRLVVFSPHEQDFSFGRLGSESIT